MNLLMGYNIKNNVFLLRKSKKKTKFPNDTDINTIGSNLTIYTIFDSEELIEEYFSHKLDLNMAFGGVLLIKSKKKVFSPGYAKKDFSKKLTNQI